MLSSVDLTGQITVIFATVLSYLAEEISSTSESSKSM